MSKAATKITADNFETEVLNGEKTIVLFTLPQSGHSKLMAGRVDKLEGRHFVVDATDCKAVCDKYGINRVPTLVVFEGNAPSAVRFGLIADDELASI